MPTFKVTSTFDKSSFKPSDLLTMESVNYELSPLIKMTAPKRWRKFSIPEWETDKKLFDSVILLLGVLPIDLHHMTMKQVSEQGFVEHSTSLMNSYWQHKRDITTSNNQVTVTDEVSFKSRLPFVSLVVKPMYKQIFLHRHKRLSNA